MFNQTVPIQSTKSLKVLVVDDDADTVLSMAMLLKLWGHDPCSASNGFEALQMNTEHQPDVVLLDLLMPSVSGFDVAKRIHEMSLFKRPFLIAMSGINDRCQKQKAAEVGIDIAFAKPVDCNQLRTVLERFSELINDSDASQSFGSSARYQFREEKQTS